MKRLFGLAAALTAVLAWTPTAQAQRVPSQKVEIQPQFGARPDIRVPYLTNGFNNLGVAQGVAPRIYSSPSVDDPTAPQIRRVYNLPFYGGIMAFGAANNGAMDRPFPYPLSR
jgi:hypothetical protein